MIDSGKEDLQQEIELPYRLGGLLYTPALNETIAQKIIEHRIPCLTSLVFCLGWIYNLSATAPRQPN